MSGGIGVFVQTKDKIGITLQIHHNVCHHISRGTHRGKDFAYLNNVQSNDVKVVPFQEELLAIADELVVTPISMERMLLFFAGYSNLELIGPFVPNAASKKNDTNKKLHVHLICIASICYRIESHTQGRHTYYNSCHVKSRTQIQAT